MPVADCGDYEEILLSPRFPVADCGVFEVGERSEVGVLESPAKLGSLEILDILAQHERKRIK
jgi:hypothetical protein